MTRRQLAVLILLAPLRAPLQAEGEILSPDSARQLRVLESSKDREALERAGRALAASGDPVALRRLGQWLARADALARLDDLSDPGAKTAHLGRVLGALEAHPGPATEALCLQLLRSPTFLADPDRKIFVLPALAAVRPMSAAASEAFRAANAEGHASQTLPLLVRNGSPRALALFEAMVRDRERDGESRVADIHAAVLPRRTDPGVLRSIDRFLAARDLEDPIAVALIETVFDYQSRRWFGPARNPPAPPPWKGAPPSVAELLGTIGAKAKARPTLPPALRATIDATTAEARAAIAGGK
jgi:hypothetical protein